MNKCRICHKRLIGRQRMFCSIRCRNTENGRKTGGWNRQNLTKICEQCSQPFSVSESRLKVARFCSRDCRGKWESEYCRGENAHGYKHGFCLRGEQRMRTDLSCQVCGKVRKTMIHHQDFNRKNNVATNRVRMCYPCHNRIHKKNLYTAVGAIVTCPKCRHTFDLSLDVLRNAHTRERNSIGDYHARSL